MLVGKKDAFGMDFRIFASWEFVIKKKAVNIKTFFLPVDQKSKRAWLASLKGKN